jgi:8-oxo-dGTP pyrophosphatase MutT (NUDIX family)
MRREFSAGGVLVRRLHGDWMMAAIRPAGKPKGLWVLPKGQLDVGESSEEAALREVAEETGAHGSTVAKLGATSYWFAWEGERIFKVVTFFLVRYEGGRLGELAEEQRKEVDDVRWLPLAEAPTLLAYRGEREMAEKAISLLAAND